MVVCCRCNRTGQCRGCACVKAGKLCSSCLPSRLGSCSNVGRRQDPASCETTTTTTTTTTTSTPANLSTTSTAVSPSPTPVCEAVSIPDSSSQNQSTSNPRNESSSLSPAPMPVLPPYDPMREQDFTWGNTDSSSFCKSIKAVYEEVTHWRKNSFQVPFGNAGKSFVAELARLYKAFASGSALEPIALMATIVLPILLLQRPHRRSKAKENASCLVRRLELWKDGDLEALTSEGRAIQRRLPRVSRKDSTNEEKLARKFANLMFQGKTHAALDLLANRGKGGLLQLEQLINQDDPYSASVREVLASKHPPGQPASPEATLQGPVTELHPIIFDSIDARLIRSTSLRVSGAAGPSGLDAHAWRRLCTAFKTASDDLCQALADFAKRLCISLLDPRGLAPFLACRLIALDKCPGVCPIGIGDTARRIIAKAVLAVIREDVQDTASSAQLCAGQISGCEAAVHSVRESLGHRGCPAGRCQ